MKINLFAIVLLTCFAQNTQSQTPISQPGNFTVSGIIHDKYNYPLANVIVKLFDKDLRAEKLLAEIVTNAKGNYSVSFKEEVAYPEFNKADLFIRVFDRNGNLQGQSDIYFNVNKNTILNFKIGIPPFRELNEFETLYRKVNPIVENAGLILGQLKEIEPNKDITFLAGELSENFDNILFLNNAVSLEKRGGIQANVYYGLFRMGIRIRNDKFTTSLNSNIITIHLQQAIDKNIITSQALEKLDDIIQRLMLVHNPAN